MQKKYKYNSATIIMNNNNNNKVIKHQNKKLEK